MVFFQAELYLVEVFLDTLLGVSSHVSLNNPLQSRRLGFKLSLDSLDFSHLLVTNTVSRKPFDSVCFCLQGFKGLHTILQLLFDWVLVSWVMGLPDVRERHVRYGLILS